eukprot:PhF_6_TR13673/c0_g1_i1/m.21975/K03241/EIF2B3; translation initiation factor eIF-2B subunit gamma
MQQIDIVILALNSGEAFHPLCADRPPSVLPICNVPHICRTIDTLRDAGAAGPIHVVVPVHSAEAMQRTLTSHFGAQPPSSTSDVPLVWQLHVVPVSVEANSTDALSHIHHIFTKDVLVISAQTVIPSPTFLKDFVEGFFIHSSTCSVLIKEKCVPPTAKDAGSWIAQEDGDASPHTGGKSDSKKELTFIAVDGSELGPTGTHQRLRYMHRSKGSKLTLAADYLLLNPCLTFTTSYEDVHVCLLQKWVLDWLATLRAKKLKKSLNNIMDEVVPYLVQSQHNANTGNQDKVESVLGNSDCDIQSSFLQYSASLTDLYTQRACTRSENILQSYCGGMRSDTYHPSDVIRCHAYIIPPAEGVHRIYSLPTYSHALLDVRKKAETDGTNVNTLIPREPSTVAAGPDDSFSSKGVGMSLPS